MTADASSRQRVITDLESTFFVEAGAGTGKTSVLTQRIVHVVAAGRSTIDRLAAVTFTEAAAAELRDRVRTGLEQAALDTGRSTDERARCRAAAQDVDQASISTIHAFAGELLRTFPIEAGLPPGFATLDEIQQALLFDVRFRTWFWQDALHEPLRAAVKRALLLGLGQESLRSLAAALEDVHDLLGPETSWEAPPPPSAGRAAAFAGTRLTQLQRCLPYALDGTDDPLVRVVLGARSSARQLLAAGTEDEALSALLGVGKLPSLVDVYPDRWRDALDGRNAGLVVSATLQAVNERISATLEAHRTALLADVLNNLRDFVRAGVVERRTQGVATFHDLLTWARDLLRDTPRVRHAAQSRFQRVFIDEFQDTDPLQAEIACYLCADERDGRALASDWRDVSLVPGKLFVVGDPKQSIYRFRGADISVYDDLLARFSAHRAQLSQNFRSVSPILEWVNHHFDRHMRARDGLQPAYAPLAADWRPPADTRGGVRRIGGLLEGSVAEAAEAEARAFAALARTAVAEGWLVGDTETESSEPADTVPAPHPPLSAPTLASRPERPVELGTPPAFPDTTSRPEPGDTATPPDPSAIPTCPDTGDTTLRPDPRDAPERRELGEPAVSSEPSLVVAPLDTGDTTLRPDPRDAPERRELGEPAVSSDPSAIPTRPDTRDTSLRPDPYDDPARREFGEPAVPADPPVVVARLDPSDTALRPDPCNPAAPPEPGATARLVDPAEFALRPYVHHVASAPVEPPGAGAAAAERPRARPLRRASYRDICILLPARTHLRRLERALEDLGVPYRVEAGKLVLATQEVRDLLACLRAIEDPSDQVALVAALRSPAYACSDVDLLFWVEHGGQLNHEQPGDGPEGPVRDALTSLAGFHHRRLLLWPPALIEAFIADRLLVASALGEARPREAWRRLRYVVSRARAFTSTGHHTLRAFLDWIEGLQRADVRDPESGSTEPDEDAIHIRTIHGAKGLEYPIVLLGGLGSPSRGGSFGSVELIADRRTRRLACRVGQAWYTPDFAEAQAREKAMASAESVRLLYVATTRARDHLVLSLFRGRFSESSAAATIERNLAEAPPDLCPPLDVPAYAPLEPTDPVPAQESSSETSESLESERTWLAARAARLASASSPPAALGWWSTAADDHQPLPNLPVPPNATDVRRNVSLLAELDGILVEEHLDLVYRIGSRYAAVTRRTRETDEVSIAARAFNACTGLTLETVNLVPANASRFDFMLLDASGVGAEH